jgi:predicted Zn-dependent protease
MKDLYSNISPVQLIAPAAAGTDNTPIVSAIIDRQGFDSLVAVLNIGANTDTNATFAVLVEHGDVANLSDAVAVPDTALNGTEALAGFTAADDDNSTRKIGYVGGKRYVRVTVTPSGNDSGNIFVSGVAILGHPEQAPV